MHTKMLEPASRPASTPEQTLIDKRDMDIPKPNSLPDLYIQHAEGLRAFFCARTNDAALAEDLLHDLFASLQNQPYANTLEHPKGYLYRSAARLAQNALRNRGASKRALKELSRRSPWMARDGADPAEAKAAVEALENLPRDQAELVALRVFGGLSFQEIATLLDKPLPTVHRWHKKALETLRRKLS